MGEAYSVRQALRDSAAFWLLLMEGFNELKRSHLLPQSFEGYLLYMTLALSLVIVYFALRGPRLSTEVRYHRWKVQNEIDRSEDGVSPTLARNRRRAGRLKWILPLLLVPMEFYFGWNGRNKPNFLAVTFLLCLAMQAVLFFTFWKISRQSVTSLPPLN